MDYFYLCVIILTELMMIAMTLHVVHYTGFTRVQKTWFLFTFSSVMLCSAAEFAVHCGVYDVAYRIPLTVITVVQFSLSPLMGVFFSGALGQRRLARRAVPFFALNAIAELVAAPFGWIFYFDAEGYHRGEYFFIYTAFYIVSLVYLVVSMFFVGKKFRRRDVVTIVMLFVILVAGIVPMTLFQIHIAYVAIAIAASLCYIYYNDLVQQDIQAELIVNQQKVSSMQEHIITGLAALIEDRDIDTGGHIARTGAYVRMLAEDARKDGVYADVLDDHFIELLCTLAPMHDVGKIVIPDSILRKPGRLTADEYDRMKQHSEVGGKVVREILSGITDEEYLSFASDIATYHHEWWDGTGYPHGLSGEQIPLPARIMAIADVYDALVSERCYKQPYPFDEAFDIMRGESGTHFDPKLIEVFLDHRDEFAEYAKKH